MVINWLLSSLGVVATALLVAFFLACCGLLGCGVYAHKRDMWGTFLGTAHFPLDSNNAASIGKRADEESQLSPQLLGRDDELNRTPPEQVMVTMKVEPGACDFSLDDYLAFLCEFLPDGEKEMVLSMIELSEKPWLRRVPRKVAPLLLQIYNEHVKTDFRRGLEATGYFRGRRAPRLCFHYPSASSSTCSGDSSGSVMSPCTTCTAVSLEPEATTANQPQQPASALQHHPTPDADSLAGDASAPILCCPIHGEHNPHEACASCQAWARSVVQRLTPAPASPTPSPPTATQKYEHSL